MGSYAYELELALALGYYCLLVSGFTTGGVVAYELVRVGSSVGTLKTFSVNPKRPNHPLGWVTQSVAILLVAGAMSSKPSPWSKYK